MAARYFTAVVRVAERRQRALEALAPAADVRREREAFVAEERKSVALLRDLPRRAAGGDRKAVAARLGALRCGSAAG